MGGSNEAAIQRYLRAFLKEIQKTIEQMVLLSARDSSSAVERPSQILRYIKLSPLQPGQGSENAVDTDKIYETFTEAFEQMEKRILLLGAPGGGKTTTLLQFACSAAQARLDDKTKPIPIFGSISSWNYKESIVQWAHRFILNEFEEIELDNEKIIYIFDGLDELNSNKPANIENFDGGKDDPRQNFLQAVEKQIPKSQVVISCRESDYQLLKKKARLRGAVTLLPLESRQIETFLKNREQSGLWRTLIGDEKLFELTRTPLLLALLSSAVGADKGNIRLENANGIFDYYISQRFSHEESHRKLPFDENITRATLARLAIKAINARSSTPIYLGDIKEILGEKDAEFLDFACAMHFLRVSTTQHVQFIHLKFRDYCATPLLKRALLSKYVYSRLFAIQALGKIGDVDSVPELQEALRDESEDVRKTAAWALRKIGVVAAVPALQQALDDKSIDVRRNVVWALGKIGEAALPALLKALKDDDIYVQKSAADVLEKMGTVSIPALQMALRDKNNEVRKHAAWALRKMGEPAIPSLLQTLQDKSSIVRRSAAEALGKLGESSISTIPQALKDAVPVLEYVLRDENNEVRRSAAWALGKIGEPTAIPALCQALTDEDNHVRLTAVNSLGEMGQVAIPALEQALKNKNNHVVFAAQETLNLLNPQI